MAAHQLPAAHGRGHDDLHLGAAQQVYHQQSFTLLGAIGKKYNCLTHLYRLPSKKRTAGRVLPCPAARGPCYSSAGCSAFSSSRRRSTLSSLLMTRLTRLMMALDAPMLPMMLV